MNQAAARGQCQPAPGPALQQPRIRACGVITLYRSNIAADDPIGYTETCYFRGLLGDARNEGIVVSAGD